MAKDPKEPAAPEVEAPARKEVFYENLKDGELYSLAVVDPDTYGRTHQATNEEHTWHGTEKEFHDAFRRVD